MLKIKYFSDLHLEFIRSETNYNYVMGELKAERCDLLILAGDICKYADFSKSMLDLLCDNNPEILYIPGNHEFYGSTFTKEFPQVPSVQVGGTLVRGDTTFIAATLWSNLNNSDRVKAAASRCINDFRVIRGFNVHKCQELFNEDFEFIKQEVAKATTKNIVIVTHFSPSLRLQPAWRGRDDLAYYFHNDLDEFINTLPENTHWIYGHTHDNVETRINNVEIHSNAMGYYGYEQTGFEARSKCLYL